MCVRVHENRVHANHRPVMFATKNDGYRKFEDSFVLSRCFLIKDLDKYLEFGNYFDLRGEG